MNDIYEKTFFGNVGLSYGQNRISGVPNCSQNYSNNGFVGRLKLILWPQICWVFCQPCWASNICTHPTLDWVNLKQFFGFAKLLPFNGILGMPILASEAIYSAPNGLTPKQKLTGHLRQKTHNWPMNVGGCRLAWPICTTGQLNTLTNHPPKQAKFGDK